MWTKFATLCGLVCVAVDIFISKKGTDMKRCLRVKLCPWCIHILWTLQFLLVSWLIYNLFLSFLEVFSWSTHDSYCLFSCRCVITQTVRNWMVKTLCTCVSHVILAVTWMTLTACTLTGTPALTYSHKVNDPADMRTHTLFKQQLKFIWTSKVQALTSPENISTNLKQRFLDFFVIT